VQLPDLYLKTVKASLLRAAPGEQTVRPLNASGAGVKASTLRLVQQQLQRRGYLLAQRHADAGTNWPAEAETMIGEARLDNIRTCVETVVSEKIPGDLIETGVWRGGAVIWMRAILAAHDDRRTVWAADSFQGLPEPDPSYPADEGDEHWKQPELAVSLEDVRANFDRYGLLDDQVCFLEGWFADTLPAAPIDKLAVIRLDGDMYGSTWDAITTLYPKLSPGGFLIVDDYALEGCRRAIEDYREHAHIEEPLTKIDWTGVFWRHR
jgi:O-methyltransferase